MWRVWEVRLSEHLIAFVFSYAASDENLIKAFDRVKVALSAIK